MTSTAPQHQPYYPGVSLRDLWNKREDIPEQLWVVDNLLPVGFTILAAREKTGKSLMSFSSIAIPIAGGSDALGSLKTSKGKVLYFALEEALPTVLGRMQRLFSDADNLEEPPEHFHLFLGDTMRMWREDSIDEIERQIVQHNNVRAVFIDTLRLVIPTRVGGLDAYEFEYKQGARLQTLALKHNISIVAIHHTTKTEYADVFDRIGGTAFSKSAETLIVLERDGSNMKMHVRGRSLPTECYQMNQDQETLRWSLIQKISSSRSLNKKRNDSGSIEVESVFVDDSILRHGEIAQRFIDLGFHESTAGRWIKDQIAENRIERLPGKRGYRLPPPVIPSGDDDGSNGLETGTREEV